MALTKKDFDDFVAAIDVATTAIAERIAKLIATQSAGGLTPVEEQQVADALATEIAKLKALGTPDSEVPVPVPEPEPVPTPEPEPTPTPVEEPPA